MVRKRGDQLRKITTLNIGKHKPIWKIKGICLVCGNPFPRKNLRVLTCSTECKKIRKRDSKKRYVKSVKGIEVIAYCYYKRNWRLATKQELLTKFYKLLGALRALEELIKKAKS